MSGPCFFLKVGSGPVWYPPGPASMDRMLKMSKSLVYPSNFSGMKFLEDEINLLLEVITRHPPPSPGGVHLVSLGLAMLLAFNSLIGTPALEKQVDGWNVYWDVYWIGKGIKWEGKVQKRICGFSFSVLSTLTSELRLYRNRWTVKIFLKERKCPSRNERDKVRVKVLKRIRALSCFVLSIFLSEFQV